MKNQRQRRSRRDRRRREDPAHAAGKRRLGPAPDVEEPSTAALEQRRHQPWVPTSGLVGRKRRSARRG